MRLFFAFDLPNFHRSRLAALLPDPAPGCRRVPEPRLHVTMRFIGNVAPETRGRLALETPNLDIGAGSAMVRGLGTFPPAGRPRVLWAGASVDATVVRARTSVDTLCHRSGIDTDVRAWTPHVTLARMRGSRPGWLGEFLYEHVDLALPSFPVHRIVMYDSVPDSGGIRYEVVAVCNTA